MGHKYLNEFPTLPVVSLSYPTHTQITLARVRFQWHFIRTLDDISIVYILY